MVGLGEKALNAGFRHVYGATVFEVLTDLRLTQAHHLIVGQGTRVSAAAYAVGLTPAHLSQAFRKRYGVPPSSLRGGHAARTAGRVGAYPDRHRHRRRGRRRSGRGVARLDDGAGPRRVGGSMGPRAGNRTWPRPRQHHPRQRGRVPAGPGRYAGCGRRHVPG
ncbi:helix-turn-helix domain-containing protein, partial [Roseospira marina]